MKYSQFNAIIPYENQFALFNSFNQKVILLLPELKELLNTAITEGIDNLKNYHPSFFKYLCQEEFIIENSIDEIEKVKALSREVDNNESSFILTINPTMNCNFKCWYCYESHIKESKMNLIVIDRVKKLIDKTLLNPKIKTFSISFFGGEPLLYFDKSVIPLINYFLDKCQKKHIQPEIGFTSNGYLISPKFIEYFNDKAHKCSLQITLDGSEEDHNKVRFVSNQKGAYSKIVENIKLLVENSFYVLVRINYTDKNITNAHKIINDFIGLSEEIKNKYILFDFHRVWQNKRESDIDHVLYDTINSFRHAGFKVSQQSPNNVINSCYADKRNSVVVNYNGDIYKCTARDFTKASREGFINEDGSLVWENNSLEKRMSIKFKNKPCLTCKIMPICNGGCSQAAIESGDTDYCVYYGDENEKDKIIKYKIEEILRYQYTQKLAGITADEHSSDKTYIV